MAPSGRSRAGGWREGYRSEGVPRFLAPLRGTRGSKIKILERASHAQLYARANLALGGADQGDLRA
ncbi:hypothetical protein Aple_025340 [Acrocarpospora pleiomorpha]|uniref:Uncharacterized protein n=1 Tax=Acrocarpospora pleiomorpha TaxID=90975 RepID=A0A5M3XN70_9ACTN|nr:hypothetical protein Aple_025340 [Acrocarpospora pleiomorpha]